ncbi:MAG: TrbI/VirB10 family protein [Janthinobacterium sp.]
MAGTAVPGALGAPPATREETLQRIAAVRQQIDAATRDDPTAAYKARLQQLQAAGVVPASSGAGQGGGGLAGGAPKLIQTAAGRNDVAQFAGSGQGDRWRLESQPEAPRSPYELRAGFVVPATLISGINSELPGQIMAQVSQDVYDTPLGKYKLIPQGSRLVGSYASDVAYGQSRILIGWQRIIFPDGKAMDIGSMPGADSAGYAGFKDQVNNHYFRLFGSAFLMSAVTAGVALSQPEQGPNNRPTASSAMSEALGQQLGNVTAQLISKNLNIAPTLEIRPGYRFNVIVTKDMTFSKPYQAFDY